MSTLRKTIRLFVSEFVARQPLQTLRCRAWFQSGRTSGPMKPNAAGSSVGDMPEKEKMSRR
jgi:hypothetical protein